MPTPIKISKFVENPNIDKKERLMNSIKEVRDYLYKELNIIDKIEDETLQSICMFSIIDCMAQEQSNYPQNKCKKVFCDFVSKHQKQCDYMKLVEPITLYYRVEENIEEKMYTHKIPREKEINLESLGNLDFVLVKDVIHSNKTEEILDYLKKKEINIYKKEEHEFVSLIYRMRSKAVHEMSRHGKENCCFDQELPDEPYYRQVMRGYKLEESIVLDEVVELIIPNKFIRKILVDCIEGYIAECIENKREPFSNNRLTRKFRLSWYDK